MFYTIHLRFPSLSFSLAIWIRELVGDVLLEVDVIRDSSAEAVFQVGKKLPGTLPDILGIGGRRLDLAWR